MDFANLYAVALLPSPEVLELQHLLAGRFSLERELGRGGMGIVFLARDVALDRSVAIKLLPSTLAAQPELRERFLREARTAAKLSHPNIVPIHLVEAHGSVVFFVMTFVDGETLGQRVRRAGPMPASSVTRLVQEVAWALAYAHVRGIVHRDVKPDNILLDKDTGRAMVTDFGIARVAGTGTMSGSGEIVGTAHYMSPEQASGEEVDGRSDLFSLGITAFYALTGTLPFDGPHLPAVVSRIVGAAAPRVADARAGVPTALANAVDRCLAKKPDARFATGEELAEAVGNAADATQLAPQIRFLLKSFQGIELAFALFVALLTILPGVVRALWVSDRLSLVIFALSALGLLAGQIQQLVSATRQVIRLGLGPADVRRALQREQRSREEEVEAVLGKPLTAAQDARDARDTAQRMSRRRSTWLIAGHVLMFVGVGCVAALGFVPRPVRGTVGAVAMLAAITGLLSYIGAAGLKTAIAVRADGKKLRDIGLGTVILGTRWLERLFRIAGAGLKVEAQNAPPAAERTEVLVAGAVDILFARLPASMQARFEDAPRVVARLRARAEQLRLGVEHSGRARGAEARDAASQLGRERLATAVAALEMIRLDLMRLESGTGTPDDLTADLEKAREIGLAVDAELHGKAEVAALLAARRR